MKKITVWFPDLFLWNLSDSQTTFIALYLFFLIQYIWYAALY